MKLLTVVGARPQFVKAAVVSLALRAIGIEEILVHTGQHFDGPMSGSFFDELDLPVPDYNLGINNLSHGAMTGRMMESIEGLLLERRPDVLLVYGDTNSTLAGALAAAKIGIPIAHVEAGLRSYNLEMPEEVNRLLTDRISKLLFAPTPLAVRCLEQEGITSGVHLVGDVMFDAVLHFQQRAAGTSRVLADHGLEPGGFHLATIHRASNTDDPEALKGILDSLAGLELTVVLPLHPRTRARIAEHGLEHHLAHPAPSNSKLRIIPPATYLDMLVLEQNCCTVITDSGGVQKEAYISRKPCFTLRSETEWQETIDAGWNRLVSPKELQQAMDNFEEPAAWPDLYGDGRASILIANLVKGLG